MALLSSSLHEIGAGQVGQTTFNIAYTGPDKGYLLREHIYLYINGVQQGGAGGVDPDGFTFVTDNQVILKTYSPVLNDRIEFRRIMPKGAAYIALVDGGGLKESDLADIHTGLLYITHEIYDGFSTGADELEDILTAAEASMAASVAAAAAAESNASSSAAAAVASAAAALISENAASSSASDAAASAVAADQLVNGSVYAVDNTEADQGVTAVGSGYTIYDVLQAVGTSDPAIIVFRRSSLSGVTNYTLDTSINASTYPNILFVFEYGTRLVRTTGDEVLTLYSTENISAAAHQQVTATNMIQFSVGGVVYPERWGAKADDSTACQDPVSWAIGSALNNNVVFGSGTYLFTAPLTYTFVVAGIGSQDRTAIEALTLQGYGQDNTILKWSSGDGIQFNLSSQQNSFHIKDMTIATDGVGDGDGLTLTNSYEFFGTFVAQSDLVNVTFRADEGYPGTTDYWANCITSANVSDINLDNVNFYGTVNGNVGTGLALAQPGDGCFSGTLTCGTVFNCTNCNWSFLGTAVSVGAHTQTVQITNSFFAQNSADLSVPFVASNTLQGLNVSNSTFFSLGGAVNIASDLPNFIFDGNLVTVNDGDYGIYIDNSNNFTISNNQFIPYATLNGPLAAINVNSTTAGSVGVIDGNTFSSVNVAVLLGAASSGVRVSRSNQYTNNASANISDTGTANRHFSAGAVTQVTNKFTAVTLDKLQGVITTSNSSLGAGAEAAFTVNNSLCTVNSALVASVTNGNYGIRVTDIGAGSFVIRFTNLTGGSLSDSIAITYSLLENVG